VSVAEVMVDTLAGGRGNMGFGLFGRGRGGAAPAAALVAYRVQVSTDGTTWSDALAEGQGQAPTTTMTLSKPTQAKFIRITQTGTPVKPLGWAIQRVRVLAIGK
jgi:hypothetical protein